MQRPGWYGFPVWTPAGFRVYANLWQDGPTDILVCYGLDGTEYSRTTIAGAGALGYLRGASNPSGLIRFGAQSNGNLLIRGTIQSNGSVDAYVTTLPMYGQAGYAVAWTGTEFVEYVLTSGFTYVTIDDRGISGPQPVPFAGGTSQGWLNVWPELVWRDSGRIDPTLGLIWPFTAGTVTVGQDYAAATHDVDRVIAVQGATRGLLFDGLGQEPYVAVSPDGQFWAASWRQLHGAIGFALLPPFVPVPPIGTPDPEPPEPPMPLPDDTAVYDRLVELRATYPAAMTNDQCVELLNTVAHEYRADGMGLLAKTSGNLGTRYDGQRCSIDYLVVHPDHLADVFADAGTGGTTTPQPFSWRPMNPDDGETPDRFVAPIVPQGTPVPPDPPTEPPTDPPTEPPTEPPHECPAPLPPQPLPPPVDYQTFLREGRDVTAAYLDRWGFPPGPSDLYHNAWRRLAERWEHQAILDDI